MQTRIKKHKKQREASTKLQMVAARGAKGNSEKMMVFLLIHLNLLNYVDKQDKIYAAKIHH